MLEKTLIEGIRLQRLLKEQEEFLLTLMTDPYLHKPIFHERLGLDTFDYLAQAKQDFHILIFSLVENRILELRKALNEL